METLKLSTDQCKITAIIKLYYNALVNSPLIIRSFLNVFSCRFSLCYIYNAVSELKAIGNTFLMLVILKNYEYFNELQITVSFSSQN